MNLRNPLHTGRKHPSKGFTLTLKSKAHQNAPKFFKKNLKEISKVTQYWKLFQLSNQPVPKTANSCPSFVEFNEEQNKAGNYLLQSVTLVAPGPSVSDSSPHDIHSSRCPGEYVWIGPLGTRRDTSETG